MAAIRKRGRYWYFRSTIAAKQADGSVKRIRHEESLKTQSRIDAAKRAADLERFYWNLAFGEQKRPSVSFAKAASVYIDTKGKSDRFIHRLIEHFGETPINEIDQAKATECASRLYPGWKGSSLNRAVWTPLSAIARLSGHRVSLSRPSGASGPLNIPDERWFDAVIPCCPPKLAALIVFLTLTGRRVGEAIALTEKDVDVDAEGKAFLIIGRTKTGVSVRCALPALCSDLLRDSGHYYARKGVGYPSSRLFGYASLQAASVALRRVCDRAGVPYYSFHKCGRHSFATRLLKAGRSIKHVQVAGGWASPQVLMSRYMHLEQSEVARDVEELGKAWGKARKIGDK